MAQGTARTTSLGIGHGPRGVTLEIVVTENPEGLT